MFVTDPTRFPVTRAIVIGAGVGGLAAALRLRAAGMDVTVVDQHDWPGGKMRAIPSDAGPIDAGPTVLTMRHVFDALFRETGSQLEDHVTLVREPLLARHFWPDGSQLDLFDDPEASADAISNFAGAREAAAFLRFSKDAKDLFELFDKPMMQAADPSVAALAQATLSRPRHLVTLSPFATLASMLKRRFSDPRLAQLFGRYATYVGGSPYHSPALLSLIWQAEASGVWRVEGGMHRLAEALADRLQTIGGTLRLGIAASEITTDETGIAGVRLANGETLSAPIVVFNGDPRALANGALGSALADVAPQTRRTARSLSARVWSFATRVPGDIPLAHHNVFFGTSARAEFDELAAGKFPRDPTLYVCAQDRGAKTATPNGAERFEIILNAAPLTTGRAGTDEVDICHRLTFPTLARFGLRFEPTPAGTNLTTPTMFEAMFPHSAGSLYGQSPHGMTAALRRPRARTSIRGLYLAGGGTHPGAGVPMAALSGRHAAEAITMDLVST